MSLRVGIDLASVELVREAIATHGDHYLRRVYTERELSDCRGERDAPDPERLAARFAAKEAALKVLRHHDDVGLALTAIEVVRDTDGAVSLELTGPAAELARAAGLADLTLSLTHEGGMAAAVVVASCA